jgi:putative SOS response-associated peptidase YedK
MCGRFTQSYTWHELVELYRLTQPARNLRPRYNIAPTTTIDVVRTAGAGLELVPMRWGFIPYWWKKTAKELPSTFNARAETVAEKPMFRSAFRRTRCIVPASGYYEWRISAVRRRSAPLWSRKRPSNAAGGISWMRQEETLAGGQTNYWFRSEGVLVK